MSIILLGYHGCGKSTIGRYLAGELWKTLVDTDALVCKHFGLSSMAEVGRKQNSAAVSDVEAGVLRSVIGDEDKVIALGARAPLNPAVMKMLERGPGRAAGGGGELSGALAGAVPGKLPGALPGGVRIFLKCQPVVLRKRLAAAALAKLVVSQEQKVEEELAKLEPVYVALADRTFDVSDLTPQDAVRHLILRCL
ncbi:MAG: hypothetical protein IT443_08320 [Phycisphaeraceae bacterium]|nr:hypothetical protein [Phycisphaeraceae bacterium]